MENKMVILLLIFLFGYGIYYGIGKMDFIVDDVKEEAAELEEEKKITRRTIISDARKTTIEASTNSLIKNIETDYVLGNITAGRILIVDNKVVEGDQIRGGLPDDGVVIVSGDGRIALTIVDDGVCIIKGFDEGVLELFVYEDECFHPDVE